MSWVGFTQDESDGGGAGPRRAAEQQRKQPSRCQTASPSPPWTLTQTQSRRVASIRVETSNNRSGFSAAANPANWLQAACHSSFSGGFLHLAFGYCWPASVPPPPRFTGFVSVRPQRSPFQSLTLRSGGALLIGAFQTSVSSFSHTELWDFWGCVEPKVRFMHISYFISSLCRNRETVSSSRSC